MKTILCIIKKPGEAPEITTIENTLESFQKIVGGLIQTVTIAEDLVIICNEEGLLMDLPYNCSVCGIDFVGPIIFCGTKEDEFSDVPLDIEKFKKIFGEIE